MHIFFIYFSTFSCEREKLYFFKKIVCVIATFHEMRITKILKFWRRNFYEAASECGARIKLYSGTKSWNSLSCEGGIFPFMRKFLFSAASLFHVFLIASIIAVEKNSYFHSHVVWRESRIFFEHYQLKWYGTHL